MIAEMNLNLILIYTVFIFSTTALIYQTHFDRYLYLENKNMTDSVISNSLSKIAAGCARPCLNLDTCKSYFYNSMTGECQFHREVFTTQDGAVDQISMQYYYSHEALITRQKDLCPEDGGFQLLSELGPCVKFVTDLRDWYDANQTCINFNPFSRLIILDSQEKNELVKGAGKEIDSQFTKALWIGMAEISPDSDIYYWLDGTTPVVTDWAENDVSSPDKKDCVYMIRGNKWAWQKAPCEWKAHFICEVDLDSKRN